MRSTATSRASPPRQAVRLSIHRPASPALLVASANRPIHTKCCNPSSQDLTVEFWARTPALEPNASPLSGGVEFAPRMYELFNYAAVVPGNGRTPGDETGTHIRHHRLQGYLSAVLL